MVNWKAVQEKLDALSYSYRLFIRGGFIFITCLPIPFSDSATIVIAVGHICIVSILLYHNLDLRTDPDQTWGAYRRSLYYELLLCVLLIVITFI